MLGPADGAKSTACEDKVLGYTDPEEGMVGAERDLAGYPCSGRRQSATIEIEINRAWAVAVQDALCIQVDLIVSGRHCNADKRQGATPSEWLPFKGFASMKPDKAAGWTCTRSIFKSLRRHGSILLLSERESLEQGALSCENA